MAKGQQQTGPVTPMRPNIEITHTLNGRVKDYAAENGLDLPEAYRRIIETGLAELDTPDDETNDHEDSETERREDVNSRADGPDVRDDRVEKIVADVSATWDDAPDKLAARRDAARAALRLAVSRGALSKSDAVDDVLPNHEVDGQSNETWWRKNVRPVLQEVGEHAPGRGYVVDANQDE